MEKIILAAVSENMVIGLDGKLPWPRIPEDMRHFRELTLGHPIMMGRVTAESIGYLEKRINLVVTRDRKFKGDKRLQVCYSIEEAFEGAKLCNDFVEAFRPLAKNPEYNSKVYIIGGEQIYRQTIGLVDRLELTRVFQILKGDAYFPDINRNEWEETNREDFPAEDGIPAYSFESYKRI